MIEGGGGSRDSILADNETMQALRSLCDSTDQATATYAKVANGSLPQLLYCSVKAFCWLLLILSPLRACLDMCCAPPGCEGQLGDRKVAVEVCVT